MHVLDRRRLLLVISALGMAAVSAGAPMEAPAWAAADSTVVAPVRALIDGEAAFTRICEAIEAARHSVWVTIAYLQPDFVMPGGRGTLFDVLDKAKARGIDVRAIFWRTDGAVGTHFFGTEEEREDADTIGGLVATLAGRVPARGEIITHPPSGIVFEIIDADPRRINRVRMRNIPQSQEAEEG